MDDLQVGTIRRLVDGFEGRLERKFGHGREAVWQMLTDSSAMAQWLAPGTIEARVGGLVKIDFADSGTVIDSRVLAFEPLSLLSYSWSHAGEPARPLRWELKESGADTTLVLTVGVPVDEDIAKACAGFDAHLEMLAAALEGVSIKFPFDLFLAARSAYRAQLEG